MVDLFQLELQVLHLTKFCIKESVIEIKALSKIDFVKISLMSMFKWFKENTFKFYHDYQNLRLYKKLHILKR